MNSKNASLLVLFVTLLTLVGCKDGTTTVSPKISANARSSSNDPLLAALSRARKEHMAKQREMQRERRAGLH